MQNLLRVNDTVGTLKGYSDSRHMINSLAQRHNARPQVMFRFFGLAFRFPFWVGAPRLKFSSRVADCNKSRKTSARKHTREPNELRMIGGW